MNVLDKYKKGDTVRILDTDEKVFILDEHVLIELYCASSNEKLLRAGLYDHTYCLNRKNIVSCRSLLMEKL